MSLEATENTLTPERGCGKSRNGKKSFGEKEIKGTSAEEGNDCSLEETTGIS